MAEEKELEEIGEGKVPGTDSTVTEQPDLGASVGPGEDWEDDPKDTMTDEEKEAALSNAKIPEDPTKGMSAGEKLEYWTRRANHFEKEYGGERTKRQAYARQFGGLNSVKTPEREQAPYRHAPGISDADGLDKVTNLQDYTRYVLQEAEKAFEHKMTEKQMDNRVEESEVQARKQHDGEDGLPAYDDLVDEYVVPMIQKNPRIFQLLRVMPDPAESSYTLGFLLKYPNFSEMLKSQSREDLVKTINGQAKQAATVKGKGNGRQPSGRLTKEEIDAMSPEDFEKELEKFRAGA